MATLKWSMRKTGDGWEGAIEIPAGTFSAVRARSKGDSKAHALFNAAMVAEHALNNPVLQAALPPQAQLALQGVKELAHSKLATGAVHVAEEASHGLKSLAKKLKFW